MDKKVLCDYLKRTKEKNEKILIFTAYGAFYGFIHDIDQEDNVQLANVKFNSSHYPKLIGSDFIVIFLEHIIAITSQNDNDLIPIIKSENTYS